nr:hypothetical protein [Tanacetum cinerariifolium]
MCQGMTKEIKPKGIIGDSIYFDALEIEAIGPPRPFNNGWHNCSIVQRLGTGRSPGPSAAILELFKRVGSERDLLRIIIMENVPPPNNNPNVLKEEPILDQAPVALVGFMPQWIEEIEDEDMVNNKEDDAEVINPSEEADPHNRPPPTSDKETEFAPPVVQISNANDVPIPPVIYFGSNFHVGESSATRDLLAGNSKIYTSGPMCYDLKSVHMGVKRLRKQMHDRYRTEKKMAKKLRQDELRMNGQEFDITALDSAVRENRSENSKMMKLITGLKIDLKILSREFTELKNHNRMAEELSRWEAWVRERIPTTYDSRRSLSFTLLLCHVLMILMSW